jgi:hypothetical protein
VGIRGLRGRNSRRLKPVLRTKQLGTAVLHWGEQLGTAVLHWGNSWGQLFYIGGNSWGQLFYTGGNSWGQLFYTGGNSWGQLFYNKRSVEECETVTIYVPRSRVFEVLRSWKY